MKVSTWMLILSGEVPQEVFDQWDEIYELDKRKIINESDNCEEIKWGNPPL